MARVIKRGETNLFEDKGDVSPDTGFNDGGLAPAGRKNVISSKKYQAKAEAESIKESAKDSANVITSHAEDEAAQIVARANEKAAEIIANAKSKGFEEGKDEATAKVMETLAESIKRIDAFESEVVPQLRDLALSIARKILGRELEFHPDAVVEIVRQALAEKARQRTEIYLRVHPEDIAIIRESRVQLLEVLSRCKDIAIREDANIERYGVIIETDAGSIDAQLETQLAVFERVLKDV